MADIGELVVRIRADASQLKAEMDRAGGEVKKSASEMGGAFDRLGEQFKELLPVVTVGALVEFTKSALEAAAALDDIGKRTGFAASTLSALEIPLKQNGSSVDEFSSSMKFMSRNIQLASEGNAELLKRFDELGLSVGKLQQLSPEQQFFALAQALGGVNDQGKLMTDLLTLMGRGAAGLAPLIKETGGNVREMVDEIKGAGGALTDEEIRKVHEWDDAWISAWQHMKIYAVEATVAVDDFVRKYAAASVPGGALPGPSKDKTPGFLSDEEAANIFKSAATPAANPAAGSNADIEGKAAAAAAAAGQKALQDYIKNLQGEAAALSLGKEKLAEYRAEKGAAAAAGKDITDLTADEKAAIDAATLSYETQKAAIEELQKEEQKHIQMVAQMEAQISSSLADIAVNYRGMGATVTNVLKQIAKQIIETQLTTPLVNSLGQALGASNMAGKNVQGSLFSGIGHLLGFASGGNPPVGVPSLVGEDGPELFVPNTAGTIVPNHALGGSGVVVNQYFNMSPGLPETVNAAIRNAAPYIADAATAAVFADMERGGRRSQIAGKRS